MTHFTSQVIVKSRRSDAVPSLTASHEQKKKVER